MHTPLARMGRGPDVIPKYPTVTVLYDGVMDIQIIDLVQQRARVVEGSDWAVPHVVTKLTIIVVGQREVILA